jgi:hypothetical protein
MKDIPPNYYIDVRKIRRLNRDNLVRSVSNFMGQFYKLKVRYENRIDKAEVHSRECDTSRHYGTLVD